MIDREVPYERSAIEMKIRNRKEEGQKQKRRRAETEMKKGRNRNEEGKEAKDAEKSSAGARHYRSIGRRFSDR